MSNAKILEAKLVRDGWLYDGPLFPPGLDELQAAYDCVIRYEPDLAEAGRRHASYSFSCPRGTSDGYYWAAMLVFVHSDGHELVIAFPWPDDSGQRDGTRRDRHMACYTIDDPTDVWIAEVLATVTKGLLELHSKRKNK